MPLIIHACQSSLLFPYPTAEAFQIELQKQHAMNTVSFFSPRTPSTGLTIFLFPHCRGISNWTAEMLLRNKFNLCAPLHVHTAQASLFSSFPTAEAFHTELQKCFCAINSISAPLSTYTQHKPHSFPLSQLQRHFTLNCRSAFAQWI